MSRGLDLARRGRPGYRRLHALRRAGRHRAARIASHSRRFRVSARGGGAEPVRVSQIGARGGRRSVLQLPRARISLGMERTDAETRAALLDFNYNLAVGNSDAAFAAVKTIKNPDVWENMAHMCIKNKRLDVAETCLGNMGHVRGARAVRDAAEEPELDARACRGGGAPGFNGRGGTPVPRVRPTRSAQPAVSSARGGGKTRWRWRPSAIASTSRRRITTTPNTSSPWAISKARACAYERAGCASAEVPRLLHSRGLTEELERYAASARRREAHQVVGAVLRIRRRPRTRAGRTGPPAIISRSCACTARGVRSTTPRDWWRRAAIPRRCFTSRGRTRRGTTCARLLHFRPRAGRYGHAARLARATGTDAELMHLGADRLRRDGGVRAVFPRSR